MRMQMETNEALRRQGWRVFRSASRDHVVPQTGVARSLQRIRINEASPVSGVESGVAVSLEDREAMRKERALAVALAEREATGTPLGITRVFMGRVGVATVQPDASGNSRVTSIIGSAPFDGFITMIRFKALGGSNAYNLAIRSTGGQTMFLKPQTPYTLAGQQQPESDMANYYIQETTFETWEVDDIKMPVFSGEDILAVMDCFGAPIVGDGVGTITMVYEAFIMARPGSMAAQSMFGALTVESRRAAREAAANDARLALERERTRQIELQGQSRIELAKLNLDARRASSQLMTNPFNRTLLSEGARAALDSRESVPPPPPVFSEAPPASPGGKGQTFVQAWNPAGGSLGYYIPDPPPGGKVNVFDSRYTVWDSQGRMVSQGQVAPVGMNDPIAPGTRVSRSLGTTPSPGMALSTNVPGVGFIPTSLVPTPSGRSILVERQ